MTTVELARELVRLSDENEQLKKINDDLMVANDVLQREVDRTAGATVLSPAVKARIKQVYEYTQDMEIERRGYGDEPMQDVHETRASFLRALITLRHGHRDRQHLRHRQQRNDRLPRGVSLNRRGEIRE